MAENGHTDWVLSLKEHQEEKFSILESILKDGFDRVARELQLGREQGHIPISVFETIMNSLRVILVPVTKTLCYAIVVLVIWFTGLRAFLPQGLPQ